MYRSLLNWVNIPFQIKPFLRRTGTGAIVYADTRSELCYPVAEMKEIVNAAGAQTISSHQLYLKGDTAINVKDRIVFEGTECDIKSIQCFYRNGSIDCKVVYI